MIPQKLTVRNFMCYREDVPTLDFDGIHLACLSGENGAGKSTVLDAITWALWGKARGKSDDDLIALGCDEMMVTLDFELNAALYRVLRRRTKGKRVGQSVVEFYIQNAAEQWQRLSADSVRDTNQQIIDTLRMTYDTFINSAFLLQGRADEFTNSKPQERKQVLVDILGLDEYERLEAQAKVRRNEHDSALTNLQGQISDLDRSAQRHPWLITEVARAEEHTAAAGAAVAAAEVAVAERRDQVGRLQGQAEQRGKLAAGLAQREQLHGELASALLNLQVQIRASEQMVARGPEIQAAFDALQAQQAALAAMDERREAALELKEHWQVHKNTVKEAEQALRTKLEYVSLEHARLAAELAAADSHQATYAALSAAALEHGTAVQRLEELRGDEAALHERQAQHTALALRQNELERVIAHDRAEIDTILQSLQTTVERSTPFVQGIPALEGRIAQLAERLTALDLQAAALAALRVSVSATQAAQAGADEQIKTITAEGKAVAQRLELVTAGAGTCPVCQSELGSAEQSRVAQMYTAEREQLLAARAAAKAESARLAAQATAQHEQIAALELELAGRSKLEREQATLQARLDQSHKEQAELATAEVQLAEFSAKLSAGDYARDEQAELATVLAEQQALGDGKTLRKDLLALQATIKQQAALVQRGADLPRQLATVEAQIAQARAAAARLPALDAEITALTTQLAAEDFAHEARAERDALRQEIDALGYTAASHEELRLTVEQLKPAERQVVELELAERTLADKRQQLGREQAAADQQAQLIAADQAQIAELDVQLRGRVAAELALRDADATLRTLQQQRSHADEELGTVKADLRYCEQMIEQLADLKASAASHTEQLSIYSELTEAFGKKGIQAMLIDHALPEIEHEANALLGRMTDHQMHISLQTQRDSRKGDPLETLDILIADGLGTRDYSMYSGGEAFRVNFAIRIALSKLLAHRAGASLRTLVVDEGFGTQDGKGRDRVVDAINAVADDFARVLVITHIQELKDLFPTQIEIIKGPSGSTWRIAH